MLLAVGAAMIIWPDAAAGEASKVQGFKSKIITLIWSMPAGIIVALIGLIFGWTAFAKSSKGNIRNDNQKNP